MAASMVGLLATWPAQLKGQGSKRISSRKQEAEEQECVRRNVHIFGEVGRGRSVAAGGSDQDPPTLLGLGRTWSICLWGSVITASPKAGRATGTLFPSAGLSLRNCAESRGSQRATEPPPNLSPEKNRVSSPPQKGH